MAYGTIETAKDLELDGRSGNMHNRVEVFRLMTLRAALKLEILGMKSRGRSAYVVLKEELCINGNRQKVLNETNKVINAIKQEQEGVA